MKDNDGCPDGPLEGVRDGESDSDGALDRLGVVEGLIERDGILDIEGVKEGAPDKDGALEMEGEMGPKELGVVVGPEAVGARVDVVGKGTNVGNLVKKKDGKGVNVGKDVPDTNDRLRLFDLLILILLIPFPLPLPFPRPLPPFPLLLLLLLLLLLPLKSVASPARELSLLGFLITLIFLRILKILLPFLAVSCCIPRICRNLVR